MSFVHYTRQQQLALEALAEYRFLTVQQMVILGVSKSATSLRDNVLKPLARRSRAPVTHQDVGKVLGTSYVWSLTKRGAKDLAEAWGVEPDAIPYPKGGIQFGSQYWHRLAQIDFHIAINQWANKIGAEVVLKHRDYVMIGSQRRKGQTAETKINLASGSYIIPDGIFGFKLNGTAYLYALEIHHGTSAQKATAKLQTYYEALMEHAISKKYKYEMSCYILSLFQEEKFNNNRKLTKEQKHQRNIRRCETKMKSVMDRLEADPKFPTFKPAYLFNTMENIRTDLVAGWTLADGADVTPF